MHLHAQNTGPGLADEVMDSQRIFRAVMNAFARPGTIVEIDLNLDPPGVLNPASASILLTLCDHETPVYLADGNDALRWVQFHTGAPCTDNIGEAQFAVLHQGTPFPDLSELRLGTDTYPDRSATLIVQCKGLRRGRQLRLEGPGIKTETHIAVDGMPSIFLEAVSANNALFPRGIDWIFTAENGLMALPRTTRVTLAEEA